MRRCFCLCSIVIVLVLTAGCGGKSIPPLVSRSNPQNGYVQDGDTAIAITEAICTPFYGRQLVEFERPYIATLHDDVWMVRGTLHGGRNTVGGTLIVKISKEDGRILLMTHGQ
jgi:hypothetical protein